MDPQANLTAGLGINLSTVERSMADVLADGRATIDEVIIPTADGRASTSRRRHRPRQRPRASCSRALGREQALREALDGRVRRRYDFVLIDCPPNLGLLTVNGLVAADSVIIPVQTQYYAMKGLTNLVKVINTIRAQAEPRPADPRPAAHVLRRPDDPRARHARRAARRRRPPRLQQHHPQYRQARRGAARRPTRSRPMPATRKPPARTASSPGR